MRRVWFAKSRLSVRPRLIGEKTVGTRANSMTVQPADDISSQDFQLTVYDRWHREIPFGLHGMFLNDVNDLNGDNKS
jgi:hypothetical protein